MSETRKHKFLRGLLERDGWIVETLRPMGSSSVCPIHRVQVERERPHGNRRLNKKPAVMDTCPICLEQGAIAVSRYSSEYNETYKVKNANPTLAHPEPTRKEVEEVDSLPWNTGRWFKTGRS